MNDTPSTRRKPRADARRNRQSLLAAADTVFAEGGVDAPLEQVARRAGVGIGTLYGHFATRRALVAALLSERNETLFDRGENLCERQQDSAGNLAAWVALVVEHAATYQGLAALLAEGAHDDDHELHADCARMDRITERLTERARDAGALRAEVTAADIATLINAAAWTREQAGADRAQRLIAVARTGLFA
ncbi:TetR/AcrR family transcriptional regulator [Nocardia cerradoensis]|uniref:Putative HTH-type transcriptional regulator TtgW n=1 Tax=Nocardia cerradoensis TaxID=85688 RepID=A0A231H0W4_9NOCA|nr:TetR/AcrR family transcriptional regulator [Nocardia cerradoensis]NKY43015.1 TetR/AcrR family transcriptional regulator [Nocardia cerradoensis]OXR42486.1 putative HTH-type transcriptional regulator TtgW [Nocardia cerradoensis]